MRLSLLSLFLCLTFCYLKGQSVRQLADINPGAGSSAAFNANSAIYHNGVLFFAANDGIHGDELWVYENSEVRLLKDINEGPKGSEIQHMHIVGGKVIFTAKTDAYGTEWWISDGSAEGTELLADINIGSSGGVYASYFNPAEGFIVYNDELYFTGITNGDHELWKTDGTAEGTKLVKNIASFVSSYPGSYAVFNNELYFSCRQGLWKTDGSSGGTVLVEDKDPEDVFGFEPAGLFATDDYLIMMQNNNLWISDGTSSGTKKIADFESINLNWGGPRFTYVNGIVLFPADDGITGDELWRTDGTAAGTRLVKDVWPGSEGYAPQNTVLFKNRLFYKGDDGETDIELFVSDGTEAGTHLFYEFSESGSGFSLPTEIVADEHFIYMNAGRAFSKELWVTDGKAINTFEIDINPSGESRPNSFYLFDNKLFCFAHTNENGFEPYIVDLSSVDLDGDGYPAMEDCDDSNANVNPGRPEIPYNGLDDDCNPETLDDDLDQDGFLLADDCDDTNPDIHPGAEEIPDNGIDEDCDGMDHTTGIYAIGKRKVKIFPNPVSTELNIRTEGDLNFEVRLFDLNGVLVQKMQNKEFIPVSHLPAGVYIMEMEVLHSNQKIRAKIVVVK